MNPDPQAIGRYTVQGVLGRGAMGVVYLAMDPLLKRLVAIKTLLDVGNEDVAITMERFHREAEISARLNHPNIITVFDVGSDPKVGPFLAMEYIEGASLSALIRKRLHPDTGMRLLIQGMSALMAAEQGGIIHRDIKSENMLVSREGRLKLMDFGIARRNESRLTQAGMVFGTPSYTAPELLLGGEPSAATDRYAFSVTAFEVITGQLPFLGSSVASTLYKVVHEPPEMPPGTDPSLAEVFTKALAKDPAERYQNLPNFMLALALALPLTEDQRSRLLSMLERDEPMAGSTGSPLLPGEPLFDVEPEPVGGSLILPPRTSLPMEPQDSGQAPSSFLKRFRWLVLGGVLVLGAGGVAAWFLTQHPTHPLVIHTDPPGAEVFLNGELMGRTPLGPIPIRDDRAKGLIRVELKGYETHQTVLEDDDKLLEFTLEREGYEIQLVTDPPGAGAFLNGEAKGTTPMRLKVPGAGAQDLAIRLDGFEEWKARLERDAPFPTPIRLTPASFQASVTSDPKGAEVFVDSRNVGRTPLPSLQLTGSEPREIRLKLAGYEDWTGRVSKGTPLPRLIRLRPRLAKVEVRTDPPGAGLVLDGRPAGTSPATLEIPVLGSHTIRMTLEGFEPRTVVVDSSKPLAGPVRLIPLKKTEPPKPKDEKKPGFWKRMFGGKKDEPKKDQKDN